MLGSTCDQLHEAGADSVSRALFGVHSNIDKIIIITGCMYVYRRVASLSVHYLDLLDVAGRSTFVYMYKIHRSLWEEIQDKSMDGCWMGYV